VNIKKALGILLGVALALAVLAPAARASVRDQATKITFNQPVQVPGTILPAGSHWFVLSDVAADRDTVSIYSSDWSKVYATVSTEPVQRATWAGRASSDSKGEIVFVKGPSGQPDAVMEWFYPGRVAGHEFLYPSHEEKQLQQEAKLTLEITPAA